MPYRMDWTWRTLLFLKDVAVKQPVFTVYLLQTGGYDKTTQHLESKMFIIAQA